MLCLFSAEELSAASGGIILIIILLIITAVVFSIKYALDIAVNKKFSETESKKITEEPDYIYAVKNETPRRNTKKTSKPQYTIIPENKLFVLEKPSKEKRNH